MFYSGVESFNYFTEEIAAELKSRGESVFILDLRDMQGSGPHSLAALTEFIKEGTDLAISYDGFGIKEDIFIELWDSMNVRCVNILMDHPLRFHETMEKHPVNYIQFCCDRNHVEYVKKHFSDTVPHVYFLPHAGSIDAADSGYIPDVEEYIKRPFDVLFSGTYYAPESKLSEINAWFEPGTLMDSFYRELYRYMCETPSLPTEEAVISLLKLKNMDFSEEKLKTVLRLSEPVDWAVRMYNRGELIRILAQSGQELYLLGRGWENHPSAGKKNFHILSDRVPFRETFGYMRQARINLNIMPHFKAGSHDRIFNIYLQDSLPVTDTSSFLDEVYGDELVRFELEKPGEAPEIVRQALSDPEGSIDKIAVGKTRTAERYTWKNLIDELLEVIKAC